MTRVGTVDDDLPGARTYVVVSLHVGAEVDDPVVCIDEPSEDLPAERLSVLEILPVSLHNHSVSAELPCPSLP